MKNVNSPPSGLGHTVPASGWLLPALALAAFASLLGAASYGPFLPAMAAEIGTSIPLLGQLPAASMLLAAALGLVVGPLADAYGPRRLLIVGLLAVVASTLGTGLAPSYAALLVTILIGAIGRAAVLPVAQTVAGTRFAGDARRRAISWTQAGATCAPLVGLPLLTTIAQYSTWRTAFLGLALLTAAVVPLVWLAVGREPTPAPGTPPARLRPRGVLAAYAPLVRHRPTLGLIGASVLISAALWTVIAYIGAFYVQRHGFSVQQVGWALIPPGLALFLGSLAGGGRLGGVPLRPLVACLRVVGALALGAAMLLPLPAGLVISMHALFAGLNGMSLVATTLLLTAESPANRATTLTLNGSANSLGAALGGALGGGLLAIGDYPALGLGALALGLASAALVWWSRARPLPLPVLATPPATGS